MTEPSLRRPQTDDIITFPVSTPPHALLREQVGAIAFLEQVLLVQEHWVRAGESPSPRSPGLHHNVSHTCTVRPDEWSAVADFIWANRARFSGVTLLGHEPNRPYPQAPLQAVATEMDIARWNELGCHPVDYADVREEDGLGGGDGLDECALGGCDVPSLPPTKASPLPP